MKRTTKRPIQVVRTWVRRQPPKVKVFLAFIIAIAALFFIRMVVYDHDNLFISSEAVHALGISVLIYKLATEKTCAGLSLKSQQLTAIFLGSRLYCSFVMEYDVHTLLDLATLATTIWVIYMMRFNLNSSYMHEKDNVPNYYVVIPCALLSLVVHPTTQHHIVNRILWAFCVYLEAVSVLPQLRVMQNTKIVEPFTAHYVFALGVARFLSCAHWILQVLDTRGRLLTALGYGLWPSMVLLSEMFNGPPYFTFHFVILICIMILFLVVAVLWADNSFYAFHLEWCELKDGVKRAAGFMRQTTPHNRDCMFLLIMLFFFV